MSAGGPSQSEPSGNDLYDGQNLAGSGVRRIPAGAGYDAGDGYQFIDPQLPSSHRSHSHDSDPLSDAVYRRRSSKYRDDDRYYRDDPYRDDPPSYTRRHRSAGGRSRDDLRRYRGHDDYSEDDDDDGDGDENKSRRLGPVSRIQRRVTDAFSLDDHDDGAENTQAKKWGATIAGAVVGAAGARTAKRDHWVPAALGAIVGGMTAREAEKLYFRAKDKRSERKAAYEADGGRRRSRSRGR